MRRVRRTYVDRRLSCGVDEQGRLSSPSNPGVPARSCVLGVYCCCICVLPIALPVAWLLQSPRSSLPTWQRCT